MDPSFSIIIPTYNRPIKLSQCLEAITALDYAMDALEVVVVDDGGTTPLDAVAASFRDRLNLKLVRQDNQGPAAARNFGVENASNEFIAFTDDDCQPDSDWLRQFAGRLGTAPDCVVGGHTINRLHNDTFAEASQLILDVVYDYYNADRENARFFTNNNFALGRELFLQLGGLDTRFRTSEDRDFCERWLLSGRRMVYLPGAIVRHAHHLSMVGFCRQHYSYGKGAFNFRSTRGASELTQQEGDLGIHLNPGYWWKAMTQRPGWWLRLRLSFALALWRLADTSGYCAARFGGAR